MDIFFCDVIGTFTGSNEERHQELERLVRNLKRLAKVDNSNCLLFCFLSTEKPDDVLKFVTEIKAYNVLLGPHFGENCIIRVNQAEAMIDYYENFTKIDQMKYVVENMPVRNIYYADDSVINQMFSKKVLEHNQKIENLVQFIPGKFMDTPNCMGSELKEIKGLNDSLERYIKVKNLSIVKAI